MTLTLVCECGTRLSVSGLMIKGDTFTCGYCKRKYAFQEIKKEEVTKEPELELIVREKELKQ